MQHYVIYVHAGSELAVRDALARHGVQAFVPRENRMVRCRGAWESKEYVLFPCYVFIALKYLSDDIYYMITCIPHVRRFLGAEAPEAISEDEAIRIGLLAPSAEALEPSVIEFDEHGTPRIVSGVLTKLLPISIHKHRRRATVELEMGKDKKQIELSFTAIKRS